MLLCNVYVAAEEGGGCYARSMPWLGWRLSCKEYVVAEEGGCCGCCYAMSMSWLKRVDAVDAAMQGVCRGSR